MMHTYIKSSKNGYRSITYIMSDKKGQSVERIADFYAGGGILDTGNPSTICEQFSRVWGLGKRSIGTIQGYTRVYAFSANEISPDDPEGPSKAIEVVRDIAENLHPDTQYILVAQRDGKSGLLHVHEFNNALHTSTLKALSGRETSQSIMYSLSQEKMEQHGIEFDAGKNHKKRKERTGTRRKEHQKDVEGRSWVEDVERRIDAAVSETLSTRDLEENLRVHGIGVSRKTKNGWTFVLLESEDSRYLGKKVAYSKLSDDYSMKSLNKKIRLNYIQADEEQKKLIEERKRAEEEAKRKATEQQEVARTEQQQIAVQITMSDRESAKKKAEEEAREKGPSSGKISLDDTIRQLTEQSRKNEDTRKDTSGLHVVHKEMETTPEQKFASAVERLYEMGKRGTDEIFMVECKKFKMMYPNISVQEQLSKYAETHRKRMTEDLRSSGFSSNPEADAKKRYPDIIIPYERRNVNVDTRDSGYDYQKEI